MDFLITKKVAGGNFLKELNFPGGVKQINNARHRFMTLLTPERMA